MTVGGLLYGGRPPLTSVELLYWLAINPSDPIGEERRDLRAGTVAAAIWNVQLPPEQRLKATDFLPFKKREKVVTDDALMAKQLADMARN